MHVVRYLPQSTLGNMLPVDSAHVGSQWCVPHDMVHGDLITRLTTNGLERASQPIETNLCPCA